jgi:hypothetical protein
MKVLTFNGLRFLELSSNADQQAARAHGFYRANANGIHLYKLDRMLEAYAVSNNRQGYFVVTATRQGDGAVRYMFSTCSTTEKWLGIEDMKLGDLADLVRSVRIEEEPPMLEVA